MKLRIVVGPCAMYVERHGVRSETRALGDTDTPAGVRAIAADLWRTIRAPVAWAVWLRHRLTMAHQRRLAARIAAARPDLCHPGPRPDLIAERPWKDARRGEWASLPHGVAARLTGRRA
jgi:hypothetical protein